MAIQQTVKTQYIQANNGVRFAYRRLGRSGGVPLIMHMHFRGNMDFWDPALVDYLAATRRVIILDQAGVGRSTGTIPTNFQAWADDLISFVIALGFDRIDLLGFSMGGCAVQMVALTAPQLVRKADSCRNHPSAPSISSDVSGMVWPRDQAPSEPIKLAATAVTPEETERAPAYSFFYHTPKGRDEFQAYWHRRSQRDVPEEPLLGLLDPILSKRQTAAYVEWTRPNPNNSFDRLGELKIPVLVMNGDDDLLIPTSRSLELLKRIKNVRMSIHAEAGHVFIWQCAKKVAEEINVFLDSDELEVIEARL